MPFPGRWADKTITTNTDQIARTFRNAGDLAHAEKLFAAAAPHWHRNPFFLHDQALVLQQLNRFPESLPILERALPETTGRNDIAAAIHNSLGVAHAKTGHPKKALENFKKALALDPANEAAMKNLRALSK
ncbi:MAG: tetratricopeptide repeat protein [Akkermansiaceae bacterium]